MPTGVGVQDCGNSVPPLPTTEIMFPFKHLGANSGRQTTLRGLQGAGQWRRGLGQGGEGLSGENRGKGWGQSEE